MKRFIILLSLILALTLCTSMMSESNENMLEHILKEFENKPVTQQFSVWHHLFNKQYDI